MNSSILFRTDAYKLSHWSQYPEDVTMVYSNFTPRKTKRDGITDFCWFGLQAFLKNLTKSFDQQFFGLGKQTAVNRYVHNHKRFFGVDPLEEDIARVEALWELQFLPLAFRAFPEGTVSQHGIPTCTHWNTNPKFPWLTNWLETWMSIETWFSSTSATTALYYRRQTEEGLRRTADEGNFMNMFQNHDFSMRGQTSIDSAKACGAAHALFSFGSDTCPTIDFVDEYYHGDENGMIVTSVRATEHSVACASGVENELDQYYRRLLNKYPGILSMVSDTWDFWKVVDEYMPALKDTIMAREGKLVLRPDSSPKTPVEIMIGDPESDNPSEKAGLIERLWDIFGGTINSKGFKELDSHIGAIYGDSITLEYHKRILEGLEAKGFSTANVVFGVGSYTYQYVTRDTQGIAIKATAVGVEGANIRAIYKDPKTDRSGKKSATGLLAVVKEDGKFVLKENQTWFDVQQDSNEHKMIWKDGQFILEESFQTIRGRAVSYL